MSKSILITGGCGFIGSNFIRYTYNKYPDDKIYNLDALTYAGNEENLLDIEKKDLASPADQRRYKFLKGNICDSDFLNLIFQKYNFDFVVNFAAETHVDRSIVDMGDFIKTNISGVRSLIEAVRTHRIPKFIQISTDEIYGSLGKSETSKEDWPLKPSSPYASSKAAADLIVQSFIRTHNVPCLIVRGSNNYGPYQYPEKLIPLAISNLIENKTIPVHGDGQHSRSWLHVEDFAEAIDLVSREAPLHEIYNVSGEEKTNLEMLDMLATHLGKQRELQQNKKHINDRPGADLRYAPDSSKIKMELGWKPNHTLSASMGNVVSWYIHNQDWWEKIKGKKEFLDHYDKQSSGRWF